MEETVNGVLATRGQVQSNFQFPKCLAAILIDNAALFTATAETQRPGPAARVPVWKPITVMASQVDLEHHYHRRRHRFARYGTRLSLEHMYLFMLISRVAVTGCIQLQQVGMQMNRSMST